MTAHGFTAPRYGTRRIRPDIAGATGQQPLRTLASSDTQGGFRWSSWGSIPPARTRYAAVTTSVSARRTSLRGTNVPRALSMRRIRASSVGRFIYRRDFLVSARSAASMATRRIQLASGSNPAAAFSFTRSGSLSRIPTTRCAGALGSRAGRPLGTYASSRVRGSEAKSAISEHFRSFL